MQFPFTKSKLIFFCFYSYKKKLGLVFYKCEKTFTDDRSTVSGRFRNYDNEKSNELQNCHSRKYVFALT